MARNCACPPQALERATSSWRLLTIRIFPWDQQDSPRRVARRLRYFCLASDYDGTLAHDGQVRPRTIEALKRVSASGRKLVLATGRTVDSLLIVLPEVFAF